MGKCSQRLICLKYSVLICKKDHSHNFRVSLSRSIKVQENILWWDSFAFLPHIGRILGMHQSAENIIKDKSHLFPDIRIWILEDKMWSNGASGVIALFDIDYSVQVLKPHCSQGQNKYTFIHVTVSYACDEQTFFIRIFLKIQKRSAGLEIFCSGDTWKTAFGGEKS